jgi:hypothetical protein
MKYKRIKQQAFEAYISLLEMMDPMTDGLTEIQD